MSNNFSSLGGFGEAIKRTIEQNQIGDKLRPHQAISLWVEIAGPQIASVSQAEAVRGKTLFVRAKSSTWANELTFYKPDILQRLNEKLGGRFIDDIHFTTAGRSVQSRSTTTAVKKPAPDELSRVASAAAPTINLSDEAKMTALVTRTKSVLEWKRANGWTPCVRCDALFEPVKKTGSAPKRSKAQRKDAGLCPICLTLTQI